MNNCLMHFKSAMEGGASW